MFNNSRIAKPFASSFATGRNTFKTNKPSVEAGDYIASKKARATYCNSSLFCSDRILVDNYNALYLYEKAKLDKAKLAMISFDAGNLNLNLFTKLDLETVCTVGSNETDTCPVKIDTTNNFNYNYTIDPNGDLFGNSVCGTYNYQRYLVPYSANVTN